MAFSQSYWRRRRNEARRRKSQSARRSGKELGRRSLAIEPFEERLLLAVNGPSLLAVIPSTGTVIEEGTTLQVAPRELLLRFDSAIDPNSLFTNQVASIRFLRGGDDRLLSNVNDVTVTPGFIGITDNPFDVIVRFSGNLPDDLYQMTIVGAGTNPLRDASGKAFNGGVNLNRKFTLDLGAQVVAVVPQPVTRDAQGKLTQAVAKIDVYFNVNDPLSQTSAQTVSFYQLIRTQDTATTTDDAVINPTSVVYSASTGKAVLTFATDVMMTTGTYRLRIGNNEPLALPVTALSISGASNTSFGSAAQLGTGGNPFQASLGTQTVQVSDTITNVPTPVLFPGSPNEPGERDPIFEAHVLDGFTSNNAAIPVFQYNFKPDYGTVLGQQAFNLITPTQMQRVREVFSYYSYYLGVEFVETASSGMTIATGDVRAINPNAPPTGLVGLAAPNPLNIESGIAIVNSLLDWGASEAGGLYFQTAMREIGQLLGLGNNFEAPALTISGNNAEDALGARLDKGEPVFPGDYDILYGQYIWPALGNDINVYRFNLTSPGQLNVETIAERLRSLNLSSTPSQLDTVITLYDAAGKIIARNDDYYGKDSFVQLQLNAGAYYVAITSTGNTNFDPTVTNSGFGGTTQGNYQLRMTFTPTVPAASSILDLTNTPLDGDRDGVAGGVANFWFKIDVGHTLFVDKTATGGTGTLGSITNPYTTISSALAAAAPGYIVRIEGNGGADKLLDTVADNLSYNIGFNSLNQPLSDGSTFNVPRGVTVMIDAGAIIKLRGANIDVGSSAQGIDRSAGALQVLGTPAKSAGKDIGSVYFTSYYNSTIGVDTGTAKGTLAKGNWGGLVFRNDSDLESAGIFLNYVNQTKLSFGGGQVSVNSVLAVFDTIHLETSRPTITYNTITSSAASAISGDPNSFEESEFLGPGYHADYSRVGPRVYGNTLSQNSVNGLFIRVRTLNGKPLDPLTVNARLANTDIIHVLKEVLLVHGEPGGLFVDAGGQLAARPSARLVVDPGIVLKMGGARIETEIGAQFIAEGTLDRPIVFTSELDDRFGASGTVDTTNDSNSTTPVKGNWGGFFFGPLSIGSIDRALVTFAGGTSAIEGGFDEFNPVEINQAQVRITNTTFNENAATGGGERNGRSPSDASVIFIRGAQPVILNNTIKNNAGAAVSVNVNSLNSILINDWGRSRGGIDLQGSFPKNTGPLIRNNLVGNNPVNGMLVRGGTITTNVIWDDTDIVHVVLNSIQVVNQQSLSGTLRLQSSPSESLVVKLLGTNTDIIAAGVALDIDDRTGGALQIVGTPNHPVVLTSLKDDTVGAGLTPSGQPQKDTLNRQGVLPPALPLLATQGPVIIDAAARDVHGSSFPGLDGWDTLQREVNYIFSTSRATVPVGNEDIILVIGQDDDEDLDRPYWREAIEWVAGRLGLTVQLAFTTTEIATVNFNNFKMVYIPSHSAYPLPAARDDPYEDTMWWGGIADFQLAILNRRKADLQDYINNNGGGLLVMPQDTAVDPAPYAFLSLPDPIILRKSGGNVMTATSLAPADWSDFGIDDNLSNGVLNIGTPYRAAFEGSTNFNRLQPWAVDPVTGEIAMLGIAAGGTGIGPPRDIVSPADWGSVRLDQLSNDRNVEIFNELEQGFAAAGDVNQLPSTAQFLGELAKDQKSGDDNVRLGFQIHGGLSQSVSSPSGADVDVYSFRGTAGTTVWMDIDRAATALDSVVELVDANGAVIARSDNSILESSGAEATVGSAKPMKLGLIPGNPSPFAAPDFYTTNPKDAGMRVVLPGTLGTVNTYFVRVRSSSSNLSNLTAGLTKGAYVLQLRLQNLDEFAGSTVRYADIRYANDGIEVIGKPEHTPLLAGTAQSSQFFGQGTNNSFFTAQDLGNLLASDRTEVSVAGSLASKTEVRWFKMDLNYDLVESIDGFSDGLKTFATMFNIEYADGAGRPDTTISVFDSNGNLLLIGRDSQVADAQPRPTMGGDSTNLSHGSYGTLDPTIGSVQLPAGVPNGSSGPTTYYIAVSSGAVIPTILDATFQLAATNPLVRLEPINSIARIRDDRIDSTGATTAVFSQQLSLSPTPYSLNDVVLYVASDDDLYTVNPFTGELVTAVAGAGAIDPEYGVSSAANVGHYDIAMRDDGRLFTFARGLAGANLASTNGAFVQVSPANGQLMDVSVNPLQTFDIDADEPISMDTPTFNFVAPGTDRGVSFQAMAFSGDSHFVSTVWGDADISHVDGRMLFTVGNRAPAPLVTDFNYIPQTQNLLFRLDPNTGAPFAEDLITNTDTHPPQVADFTPVAYQPYSINPKKGGSGTVVVPRGTLTTGVYLIAADGNAVSDGTTFQVVRSAGSSLQTRTFEMDIGNGVGAGNFPVLYTIADTSSTIANTIAVRIGAANIPVPFGPPGSGNVGAASSGATVTITGSRFTNVGFPFKSDSLTPGPNQTDLRAFSPDITGLAFVSFGLFDQFPQLFAVSTGGGVYEVLNYTADDGATLRLLNVQSGFRLSGLTAGPTHLGLGQTLFATASPEANLFGTSGSIVAFDTGGNLAPVFSGGQSSKFVFSFRDNFAFQGLAFSTLDFNLWHVTPTRSTDSGHGITPSFDFDAGRNSTDPTAPPSGAGQSYYFGFEDPRRIGGTASSFLQPGAQNYMGGGLSGNQNLFGSYNLPGGALGSLVSSTFNLEGATTADKPTLYFNYLLDTEGANSNQVQSPIDEDPTIAGDQDLTGMRDSFRVFASTDGVTWLPLVTNNSILSSRFTINAELPAISSASGGTYQGDSAIQRVQEAFDPLGVSVPLYSDTNAFDEPAATKQAQTWRQARVDLGDFAGKSNVRLRFDFSSAGSMNQGLAGDQFGEFSSEFRITTNPNLPGVIFMTVDDATAVSRAQNNNHEGVYIDDVVVGFAGRGEMVTGLFDPVLQLITGGTFGNTLFTNVTPNPLPGDPQKIYTGDFELHVRRGTEYASTDNGALPFITLNDTFNVNDRLARGFTLVAPAAAQIVDGQTFRIDDGSKVLTFEFDKNGSLSNASNERVTISSAVTPADVAKAIRDAVNMAITTKDFKVSAGIATIVPTGAPTGGRVDLFDALQVEGGPLQVLLFGAPAGVTKTGLGDVNSGYWKHQVNSAPGQTIIQNNIVSDSRQVGIQVIPVIGQIEETAIAFTVLGQFDVGTPGRTGSIAQPATLNTRGWIPGVTVKNNLVVASGRTGIQVGGDPNASYSYAQEGDRFGNFSRDIELLMPYVRVVNNTVYDARNGIAASNASSPTIVNNIIANAGVTLTPVIRIPGAAIYVDDASGAPKPVPNGLTIRFGDTVVGANVYQNNVNNVLGTSDTNAIVLQLAEPLFVDASKRNFYLAENSRAIDSSVNSVQERGNLLSVLLPLGMPPSPIQAPETDLLGQLRVDDPLVPTPPGLGSNVFKDRGALERTDFIGPTAALVNPVDNDPNGIDRNPQPNSLVLVNQQLTDFTIQLIDELGVGIDDSTVTASTLVIQRTSGGVTVTLTPNVDYVLAYDTNNKTVKLIPAQGIWLDGTYTITLDSSIKDLANNALQPNEPPNTQFVIQLTDQIVSPWQNPNNQYDVNADGRVTGLDLLLVINQILAGLIGPLPLVANVPPYIDVSGNGSLSPLDALQLINYINSVTPPPPGALVAPLVTTSTTHDSAGPSAAPATSTTDTNSVATAFAMAGAATRVEPENDALWSPAVASEDVLAETLVATASPPMEESHDADALAAAMSSDELDALNHDLDSILTDLTGDMR